MKREGPSLTHYAQPECVRIYGCVHARVRMYRVPLCPHQKDMLRTYVPNIPASGAWLTASADNPIS